MVKGTRSDSRGGYLALAWPRAGVVARGVSQVVLVRHLFADTDDFSDGVGEEFAVSVGEACSIP